MIFVPQFIAMLSLLGAVPQLLCNRSPFFFLYLSLYVIRKTSFKIRFTTLLAREVPFLFRSPCSQTFAGWFLFFAGYLPVLIAIKCALNFFQIVKPYYDPIIATLLTYVFLVFLLIILFLMFAFLNWTSNNFRITTLTSKTFALIALLWISLHVFTVIFYVSREDTYPLYNELKASLEIIFLTYSMIPLAVNRYFANFVNDALTFPEFIKLRVDERSKSILKCDMLSRQKAVQSRAYLLFFVSCSLVAIFALIAQFKFGSYDGWFYLLVFFQNDAVLMTGVRMGIPLSTSSSIAFLFFTRFVAVVAEAEYFYLALLCNYLILSFWLLNFLVDSMLSSENQEDLFDELLLESRSKSWNPPVVRTSPPKLFFIHFFLFVGITFWVFFAKSFPLLLNKIPQAEAGFVAIVVVMCGAFFLPVSFAGRYLLISLSAREGCAIICCWQLQAPPRGIISPLVISSLPYSIWPDKCNKSTLLQAVLPLLICLILAESLTFIAKPYVVG